MNQGRSERWLRAAAPWVVTAAGSLLLAALVLEAWKADFSSPWVYERDAIENLVLVKNTLAQGWPIHNALLGAPFGQDLYDFPVVAGDPLHLLIIKIIGLFSSNPALVVNVFYLVQFPLIALSALWVLRRVGIRTWSAAACAVLFALAPYHLYRGEMHLFLAGCWSVPLGVYVVVSTLLDERPPMRWPVVVILGVIIGTSDVYYASLTLVLLVVAVAAALVRRTSRPHLLRAGGVAGTIVVALAIAHSPTLLYHVEHGQNAEVAKARGPAEVDVFGLRFTRMVVPVDGHRLAPLAHIARRYNRNSSDQGLEKPPQALGTLATLGYLFLIGLALLSIVSSRRRLPRGDLIRATVFVTIAATLIGVSGGVAGVITYYVTSSIRSWNRYSVFIAFAALVPIGLVFSSAAGWLRRRGTGTLGITCLLVGVVVLGAYDQAGTAAVPNYKAAQRTWNRDATFTEAAAGHFAPGTEVFELPYIAFPEWGYEMARGYLHTNRLRWSFGAMQGRSADWASGLVMQPGDVVTASAAAAGFGAVYLDRTLYPDRGKSADTGLRQLLGPPVAVSTDQALEMFDLRRYKLRLRSAIGTAQFAELGSLTLAPPRPIFGPSFGPLMPDSRVFALGNLRSSNSPSGWIDIVNPSPHPRAVRIDASIGSTEGGHLVVQFPAAPPVRITTGGPLTPIKRDLRLLPGHNRIQLRSDVADVAERNDFIDLRDFRIVDLRAHNLAVRAISRAG